MKTLARSSLHIHNAHEHNLKHLSLSIPQHQLIVVTGPSGSGKTSLVFDTIAAEAVWRFAMLGDYQGTFAHRTELQRPAVDAVEGLPFTTALPAQQYASPMDTVATVTGLYEALREVFFLRGAAHCTQCGDLLHVQRMSEIAADILAQQQQFVHLQAPLSKARRDAGEVSVEQLVQRGMTRVVLDDELRRLENVDQAEFVAANYAAVLVDAIAVNESSAARIDEAIALALEFSVDELHTWVAETSERASERRTYSTVLRCRSCGLVQEPLRPEHFSYSTAVGACAICAGTGRKRLKKNSLASVCEACQGSRVRPEVRLRRLGLSGRGVQNLAVKDAKTGKSFAEVFSGTVGAAAIWAEQVGENDPLIARTCAVLRRRLQTLSDLGLHYLELHRSLSQLSAGETQRVLLARAVASSMSGILYVLDEATSGLHPQDVQRVVAVLRSLVEQGNSVIAIDHDTQLQENAAEVIELGPGAGAHGGEVVYQGPPQKAPSLGKLRTLNLASAEQVLTISGVTAHNVRNVTVSIPLNRLVAFCGVSGAGKSTVVSDCLAPSLRLLLQNRRLNQKKSDLRPFGVTSISGWEAIDSVVELKQRPTSPQAHSLIASALGILPQLRELYAKTVDARLAGLPSRAFSFSSRQWRCSSCQGRGVVAGGETTLLCPECLGGRLARIPAAAKLRGRTFAETLALTVEEFQSEFAAYPQLIGTMQPLAELGLQYLRLDQPIRTLSLGERQRLRMSAELRDALAFVPSQLRKKLFLFDEPTRGLHRREVVHFVRLAQKLLDLGHSVVVVEHQLDVLQAADWLIELGPGAGEAGGQVIFAGTQPQARELASGSRIEQYLS